MFSEQQCKHSVSSCTRVWVFEEAASYKRVPSIKQRNQDRRLFYRAICICRLEAGFSEHGGAQLTLGDKRLERVLQEIGVCTSARPNAFFEFLQTDTSRCECV